MDWVAIRQETAETIRKSVEDYVSMSGMGPWDTPESWIQNEIAQKLKDQFYIMLEIRTPDLLDWHAVRAKKVRSDPDIRNGRVDLALFDRTDDPSEGRLVLLIETKKYARRWACADDVIRLRELSGHFGLKSATLSVLFVCASERACERSISELIQDCEKIQADKVSRVEFERNDEYCAAAVIDVTD